MVEDMIRAAKNRRMSRTLSAFGVGLLLGSLVFVSLETGFLAGLFFAVIVCVLESKEVARVQKIQKPWRDE
jgi:hypothetical protein